jgi:LexA-binding, inner membrane-associated putative hydrolase
MDTLSHALWAGAVAAMAQRVKPIENRTIGVIVVLAALPDVIHLAPIVAWALFGDGTFAALYLYALALPGQEPLMPAIVELLAHHFHCIMHSAVVAGAVTLIIWLVWRVLWIPMLGWWSHVVMDVVTHSADYYPSPVLYPFTNRGFDGLAWNEPTYLKLNYALLVMTYIGLFWTRKRHNVD